MLAANQVRANVKAQQAKVKKELTAKTDCRLNKDIHLIQY